MTTQEDFPLRTVIDDLADFVIGIDSSQLVPQFKDAKWTVQDFVRFLSKTQGIHLTISSSYSHDFTTPLQIDDDSLSFVYFDDSSIFDFDDVNYRVTPTEEGLYAVSASILTDSQPDGSFTMPKIRKDGLDESEGTKINQRIAEDYVMPAFFMLYLDGTEYIDVALLGTTNPITINANEDETYLQVVKVAD